MLVYIGTNIEWLLYVYSRALEWKLLLAKYTINWFKHICSRLRGSSEEGGQFNTRKSFVQRPFIKLCNNWNVRRFFFYELYKHHTLRCPKKYIACFSYIVCRPALMMRLAICYRTAQSFLIIIISHFFVVVVVVVKGNVGRFASMYFFFGEVYTYHQYHVFFLLLNVITIKLCVYDFILNRFSGIIFPYIFNIIVSYIRRTYFNR